MWPKLYHWYRSTFGYAVVAAAVLWAALPPWGRLCWPLAWVAPVWWVLLIRSEGLSGRRPYRALWLAGFLFWLAAVYWLWLPHWTTRFGWVAISFYLAFYLPVFVGLGRVAVHRLRVPVILAAPIVWAGLELARGHLLTGFTMASLGHTQYRWIELIQLSDLAGAYGVSFLVMLVAACLARMLPCDGQSRTFWPLLPAGAAVAAALLYGYVRTSGPAAGPDTPPATRVALIQGSTDTEIKADPEKQREILLDYFELSRDAVRTYGKVDLIVWPETMFRQTLVSFDGDARKPPQFDCSEAEFRQWLEKAAAGSRDLMALLARRLDAPLILGVDRHHYGPQRVEAFNSAALVARSGELLDHYDKMHLVVFGEYVPLAEYFPWVHRLMPMKMNLSAGTAPVAFATNQLRFAPNICYETVIPHLIRRQVNDLKAQDAEPDVLVNLTNDGWFWGSSELDMHLICGVFRAVECRKPLLIAANTGFSAWIDGDGRILNPLRRRATDVILAKVRADPRDSWYLRHGDWPAGVCLAACVLFGAVGTWDRIRRRVHVGRTRPDPS